MRLSTALFAAILILSPASALANVHIVISIADQTMDVTHESSDPVGDTIDGSDTEVISSFTGVETHHWDVTTGRKGHETPTGTYTATRLSRHHRSNEYHRAPMPNSIFFDDERGIAIHSATGRGVNRLGRPGSHGCVRLAPANSRHLYEVVEREGVENTTIEVR